MNKKFLEGRGCLITGGASGFGRGFARAYAKRGADIAIVDINEENLEKVTKELEADFNCKVVPIVCDVSQSDEVKAMAKQAFNELDNIYVLNNNAGVGDPYGKDLIRIKEKSWDRIMNINLKGQWLVGKFICKKMKKQKFEPLAGKIIHTASIAGMEVDEKLCAYSIAKAGVIAMMQTFARMLAPKITVNSISPGYHVTGIYNDSEEVMKFTMEDGHVKTPLNRLGTVKDVVDTSVFLASPASNFTTGHNFPVDGGIAEIGVPPHYYETEF